MRRLPRSLVIVGGAATGCQLASIFDAFGTQVTLLEVAPRILSVNDAAVGEAIAKVFNQRGIQVTTSIGGVQRIDRREDMLEMVYTQGGAEQTVAAEAIIMSVGWIGNVDQINLAAAGIETARNYIVVDQTLRTSQPHIFAAGDITGRMMLVQGASDEARAAAQNAVLGRKRLHEHRVVPSGGFTDPEYGSVGMTEAAAREQHDVVVAQVPFAELDRALIDGRREGFCKLIVSRETHAILGAHVVGEQAVELVHIIAALMHAHSTVEHLAQLEIAYPTFAAVLGLAARHVSRQLGSTYVVTNGDQHEQLVIAEWERG